MLKAELEERIVILDRRIKGLIGLVKKKDLEIQGLQNKIKAYELEKSDGIAWEITLKRLNKE